MSRQRANRDILLFETRAPSKGPCKHCGGSGIRRGKIKPRICGKCLGRNGRAIGKRNVFDEIWATEELETALL